MAEGRYIVVGGGLAGLMTVLKLAEAGKHVDLFSIVPVKRSHSVCAQGGINGAVNTKGEGDHPDIHVKDTLYGGDFLADQPPVKGMCYAAPGHHLPARPHGRDLQPHAGGAARLPALRRHAPPPHRLRRRHHRPAAALRAGRAGAPLRGRRAGPQVRVLGVPGHACSTTTARCRGIVALDLRTHGARRPSRPRRSCLATGGPGIVFGHSTNSVINTGVGGGARLPAGRLLRQRRVHPGPPHRHPRRRQAPPHERVAARRGRPRLGAVGRSGDTDAIRGKPMPPRASAGTSSRSRYPKYGNLVPARHRAPARSSRSAASMGLGVDGRDAVYLDVTHIPRRRPDPQARRRPRDLREVRRRRSARTSPMKIFPAMHYSMGGLWVDYEADAEREHRPVARATTRPTSPASTPPARATTSTTAPTGSAPTRSSPASTPGRSAGPAMALYAKNARRAPARCRRRCSTGPRPTGRTGSSSIRKLAGQGEPLAHRARARRRHDRELHGGPRERQAAQDAARSSTSCAPGRGTVNVLDTGKTMNQSLAFVNQLWNMLELAKVIAKGALLRDEFRGSHYKPEFSLPRPKTQQPQGRPGVHGPAGRPTPRSGARPPSPGTPSRARRSPTATSPRPVLAPEPRHYD